MPLPKDKKKFALWLHPQTLEEISGAYASDNCRSKSESVSYTHLTLPTKA